MLSFFLLCPLKHDARAPGSDLNITSFLFLNKLFEYTKLTKTKSETKSKTRAKVKTETGRVFFFFSKTKLNSKL